MVIKFFVFVVLTLSAASMAGELSPQLHVGSQHYLEGVAQLNENNPGAGVVYEGETFAATAGGYYNSHRDDTFYAGAGYHWQAWGLDHRLIYGAVTGYGEHTAQPTVNWQLNKGPVTVSVMPGVVGLSLEY